MKVRTKVVTVDASGLVHLGTVKVHADKGCAYCDYNTQLNTLYDKKESLEREYRCCGTTKVRREEIVDEILDIEEAMKVLDEKFHITY